ncbi:hypothetical protein [Oricola sp.]|uniref:hypothetical protein n=1 Tax=Oricola sp. TaxID=1979950 RepID=UPI002600806D|nr:hypothetical protein [Oricola sp.]MCI5078422.1 hypothetical protein [Oricola sp.]
MQLSSLVDDYRSCEAALARAIENECDDVVRELDVKMAWLRKVIRAFPATRPDEKRLQIDFFMDVVSQATDADRDVPALVDLEWIVQRNLGPDVETHVAAPEGEVALDGETGRALLDNHQPRADVLAMIERTNLRMALIGRDWRYRYTSPANGQFHSMPVEAFREKHLADLIGDRRFNGRARAYLQRCFKGEDVTYCYFLETKSRGRLLLECRMLSQRASDESESGAIIVVRDLTNGYRDPVQSAVENHL